MKKIVFILMIVFAVFLSVSLSVSATLVDNNVNDGGSNSGNNSQGGGYYPDDAKLELEDEDLNFIIETIDILFDVVDFTWINIGYNIQDFSYLPATGNSSSFTATIDIFGTALNYSNIFKLVGYTISLLFIGLNFITIISKYELMTFKGGASIVMRVIFAKVFVDLSYEICEFILIFNDNIVSAIIDQSRTLAFTWPDIDTSFSGLWIIGPIIDFFNILISRTPLLLFAGVLLITGAIIAIKLMIRMIELAIMVTVSPAFFACLSGGEATSRYFRNFIVTFASVVFETLFMAIVYVICMGWWQNVTSTTYMDWLVNSIPNLGLAIVMCIMMVKPPRILKNLIA